MSTVTTQPLKWPGGKFYMTPHIVDRMPRHVHYVEPYCGGCAMLLARDPDDQRLWLPPHKGVSELVNDINGGLINFWRVLQDETLFANFYRRAQAIPLARHEWTRAHASIPCGDPVEDALAFFVDCRQSRAGGMKGFTPMTRKRTRRRMNGNVSEWLSAVDGLPEVHARLRRVVLENRPALDLIKSEDTPGTLFYCDPPYLHETRTTTDAYAHEMTRADHEVLLATLLQCQGKVMLSGYPSELYDRSLEGWTRHTFNLPNNVAGGKSKQQMTEVLWCNF
jgi:DNA adenine methylase